MFLTVLRLEAMLENGQSFNGHGHTWSRATSHPMHRWQQAVRGPCLGVAAAADSPQHGTHPLLRLATCLAMRLHMRPKHIKSYHLTAVPYSRL